MAFLDMSVRTPSPMAATRESRTLGALTGARFFAAFAVVLTHYAPRQKLPAMVAAVVAAGPVAVSFFYVLSGAVLTWGCTNPSGSPARPTRVFWLQRAARIAPAYFLALLASLPYFVTSVLQRYPGVPGVTRCAASILANLMLVQAFIPPVAVGLNTPGWSISCEGFFYLAWAKAVGWLRHDVPGFPLRRCLTLSIPSLLLPMLGTIALSRGWLPAGPFPTVRRDVSGGELLQRTLAFWPPLRMSEFAMGIVLGHALRVTPQREQTLATLPARVSARNTSLEAVLIVAIVGATCALGGGLPSRITGVPLATQLFVESGVLAPLFALLIWQLARGQGLLQRFLSLGPVIVLGEASYALYICQEPVLQWFSSILRHSAPQLAFNWGEPQGGDGWAIAFPAYALVLVASSVIIHRAVELPARAWLLARWLASSKPKTDRAIGQWLSSKP